MPGSRRDVCTNSGKPLEGFLIRTKFLQSLYLPLLLWIPGFPKGLPDECAWTTRRIAWHFFSRAHVFSTLPPRTYHALRVTVLYPFRLGWLKTFLTEGLFFLSPHFWRRQCHGHRGSSEVLDEWVLFPHLTFMENYCWGRLPPPLAPMPSPVSCPGRGPGAATLRCYNRGWAGGRLQSAFHWSHDPWHWGVQIIPFDFLANKSMLIWEPT